MKRVFFLSIMSFVYSLAFSNGENKIYVSINGNDNNSGDKNLPFKTIYRALDEIKKVSGDCSIILEPGSYNLDKTLIINNELLGNEGRKLTIKGNGNPDDIILNSDYNLKGWKKVDSPSNIFPHLDDKANLWCCDISDLDLSKRKFKVMYDGDKIQRRARSNGFNPNTKKLPRFECWEDLNTLYFPKNTLKNWDNLDDIEIFIRPNQRYVVNYLPLASVDTEKGIAKTSVPATYFMGPCEDHEYSVSAWYENSPEALDEKGEWIVNSHSGIVYYLPETEKPSDSIYIPLLSEYLLVTGNISDKLEGDIITKNVSIENITFTRGDRNAWLADDKGLQHDWDFWDKDNALVRMRGVEDCSIRNCIFKNSGCDAIRFDRHAQNNIIEGCKINNIGGTGILLAGYGPGIKDVNHDNKIYNNDISYCGLLYWHAPAIFIWESGSNIVSHNRISYLPYNGIVVAGVRPRFFNVWTDATIGMNKDVVPKDLRENMRLIRWNETGKPKNSDEVMKFNMANNNIIEDNEISNCVELLKDGNPVYYSAAGYGNILRRNLIYNSPNSAMDVRFDDDQFDVLAEENIIYGLGFRAKHGNKMINNYVFGGSVVIGKNTSSTTDISKNVFVLSTPSLYRGYYGKMTPEKRNSVHNNLLKSFSHDNNLFFMHDNQKIKNELNKLKKLGMDKGSVVADPSFVNYKLYNLDFKKNSKALNMGINPIDYKNIGLIDESASRFYNKGLPKYKRVEYFLYEIK